MTGRESPQDGIATILAGRISEFLAREKSSSVLLALATVTALVWSNSPMAGSYESLWGTQFSIVGQSFDVRHFINDVLMTIFFLVVGLEIKRELVEGSLRDRKTAMLPAFAAIGGMVVPAAIYLAFTLPSNLGTQGWGIPMATDIAFAIGLLGLLGNRIPSGAKVFLLTLAIADDIGAILVIAVFYSTGLAPLWLLVALGFLVAMRFSMKSGSLWIIVPLAVAAWVGVYLSGVHPTIAGVAIGLAVPPGLPNRRQLIWPTEHFLHPYSAFLILPIFALANAGVALNFSEIQNAIRSPVSLGIAIGLLVGKPIGITLFALGALAFKIGKLPPSVNLQQIFGVSILAGVGFTVALFVSSLAFGSTELASEAKIGVLAGSILAGVVGLLVLTSICRRNVDKHQAA